MKYRIALIALLVAFSGVTRAEALKRDRISADAKWLIHVDLDKLRQTQVGDFLVNQLLVPQVAQIGSQFKLNATNILQRIGSLTAYGADFKTGTNGTGVLLINCDADTQKVLEGLLAAQILANTNGPIKQLPGDDSALYTFGNEIFISSQKGGLVVISRSQAQIQNVRELVAGRAPSLTSTKTFASLLGVSDGFFLVGVADALNIPDMLPVQAKILQMSDGGRIALGEKGDQLVLDVALHGKTAEVARQIRQVVEGMIALLSLAQPDNPQLTELAKSINVSSEDQMVTLHLAYRVSEAIAQLNETMAPKPKEAKTPRQKSRSRLKHKQEIEPESAAEKPEAEAVSKNSK